MFGEVLVSLGGIAFIVALAWLLGRDRASPVFLTETAKAIAEDALCGFDSETAFVDAQRRAAIVDGTDGRLAVLKPHGDHWSVRVLTTAATASVTGDDLIVTPAEPMFGSLRLSLDAGTACMLAERIGKH